VFLQAGSDKKNANGILLHVLYITDVTNT